MVLQWWNLAVFKSILRRLYASTSLHYMKPSLPNKVLMLIRLMCACMDVCALLQMV